MREERSRVVFTKPQVLKPVASAFKCFSLNVTQTVASAAANSDPSGSASTLHALANLLEQVHDRFFAAAASMHKVLAHASVANRFLAMVEVARRKSSASAPAASSPVPSSSSSSSSSLQTATPPAAAAAAIDPKTAEHDRRVLRQLALHELEKGAAALTQQEFHALTTDLRERVVAVGRQAADLRKQLQLDSKQQMPAVSASTLSRLNALYGDETPSESDDAVISRARQQVRADLIAQKIMQERAASAGSV